MNIQKQISLGAFLTLKTATKARYFTEADSLPALQEAIAWARYHHLPYCLIGGGSNLVFRTDEYPGLIIKNSLKDVKVIKEDERSVTVLVGGGCPLALLINRALAQGWSGLEYHRGLPGTVGGALAMNSKWTKPLAFVSDNLIKATLLNRDGNRVRSVKRPYFRFAYDFSTVQTTGEIIVDGSFHFPKAEPALLRKRAEAALAYRKETQPVGAATCGCFFQNISAADQRRLRLPTASAGYLIDRCGLKGVSVGGFSVSAVHANFIVNLHPGESCLGDLFNLTNLIKTQIEEKYQIKLKEEVVMI
ncbi:UDP-N-acetylmuramate dehydrogenase [Patescibacteria group bacterium]|nr:UDP-N-acetylmuramate dehydrogenase [Patescibacteria group bacterium]MCL5091767.1 UDP-N-acetylmuramate dehydrogenase [Patescibacteria group bacterium]